jgi:hypothetical protein
MPAVVSKPRLAISCAVRTSTTLALKEICKPSVKMPEALERELIFGELSVLDCELSGGEATEACNFVSGRGQPHDFEWWTRQMDG